jgi:hypothetical protein
MTLVVKVPPMPFIVAVSFEIRISLSMFLFLNIPQLAPES